MESTLIEPKLYIPSYGDYLSPETVIQVRLGLQGYPGTGKTTSYFTFPNLVILDLDNKLGNFGHRTDVMVIRLWDINNKFRVPKEEKHETVLRWLKTEGLKLHPSQTVALDSWSTLQNWFDMAVTNKKHYTNKGVEDNFIPWRLKGQYASEVCESLKSLPCNSVTTFHEAPERDEEGRIVGLKPLMTGAFADQLAGQFTDWFRQVVMNKKAPDGKTDILVDGKVVPEYLWQVRSDGKVKCLTSKSIPTSLMFVPADYKYFATKY